MSVNRWLGDAAATEYEVTLTVGSAAAGETFVTTINGKSITYTAGASETTSTVAAAVQSLLDSSTIPEFRELAWTVDTAVVTGTGRTAGVELAVTESGTGTYTASETQATGPSFVDNAANWSLGTTPGATDDVLIDGGPDVLYGFGNISAAAYNSFVVKASFGGKIGLPYRNDLGYVEYRTRYWPMATAVPVEIGEGDGTGPQLVNLDVDTAADVTVWKTRARQSDSLPVVNVNGAGSGTVVVVDGDVGLAADDNTASVTLTSVTVGAGTVTVGPGATVTTLNQKGGTVTNYGATPTVVIKGGLYTLYGTAATAVTADPAADSTVTVDWRAGGTIGTATFVGQPGSQGPVLECNNDPRTKTLTNSTFTGGARLNDPDGTVVFTNPATGDRASLAASDLGARFTFTRTII